MQASPKPDDSAPSFESAMERLDDIVAAMEGERMPLDQMVSSYEEGARMLSVCRRHIDNARQRVELIHAELEGQGKATLTDFSEDSGEDAAAATKQDPRPRGTPRRRQTETKNDADDDISLF